MTLEADRLTEALLRADAHIRWRQRTTGADRPNYREIAASVGRVYDYPGSAKARPIVVAILAAEWLALPFAGE